MKFDLLVLATLTIPSLMIAEETDDSACCASTPQFCLDKSGKFEVFGDYLYWEAREDQLTYAQGVQGGLEPLIAAFSGGTNGLLPIDIKTYEADFDWKSGFRVGGGYYFNCCNWDLKLFWTSLHAQTTAHVNDPDSGLIPSNFPSSLIFNIIDVINSGGELSPALASGAHNKWHLKFDTLDFELGRSYFLCCGVALRPFLGIKGAWIDQNFNTSYDGIFLVIDENVNPIGINVSKKNNFHAIGPTCGMDLAWEFFCNFSLVGDLTLGALYGRFQNKIQSTENLSFAESEVVLSLPYNKHRIRPMVNASIGVEYNNCNWQCFQFAIGAAYEVQYWWNQWQVPVSSEVSLLTGNNVPQGDLMLHGLTVHAGVAF